MNSFFRSGLHPVPVDVIPVFVLLEVPLVRVGDHLGDQLVPVFADDDTSMASSSSKSVV